MSSSKIPSLRWLCSAALSLALLVVPMMPSAKAQTTVTGAFFGTVSERGNQSKRIVDALIEIRNTDTGVRYVRRSDRSGNFYLGALPPGNYRITVSVDNGAYMSKSILQILYALRPNEVVPVPVELIPAPAGLPTTTATAPPPVTTKTTKTPKATKSPKPSDATASAGKTGPPVMTTPPPQPPVGSEDEERASEDLNRTDGRLGGAFAELEVSTLPLGATTLIRTFDELALLLPGVTLPPYTSGNGTGPGVGVGVGSAGQFAVNGMPPRANNFTVDGSDNNDEDVGVRRQGFVSLVPQPIESIREYQVITLLAPAQFGRNIGAQVNAISKSGSNQFHGTGYGFFNSSQLNARNFFDTGSNSTAQLTAGSGQGVVIQTRTPPAASAIPRAFIPVDANTPFQVQNQSGGKDSSTLGQFGFVLGGPIKRDKLFFFISAERQVLNASQETSFAVPTVEERSFNRSGATGLFQDPFNILTPPGGNTINPPPTPVNFEGQSLLGAAYLSLFPFPNNTSGVYGRNTFTQVLPASGHGTVASGKIDYSSTPEFFGGRRQDITGRYNFTDDERFIPAAGGALFATLRPQVKTHNLSAFFTNELSNTNSSRPLFNELRLSYGRTRLDIGQLADRSFLLGSQFGQGLLNAPLIQNATTPSQSSTNPPFALGPNTGPITLVRRTDFPTTDQVTGPLGQVIIGGFSPVGADVFNFPQNRVNNTYQLADTVSYRRGASSYSFGVDLRRTELNSTVPRNFRPQAAFYGSPLIQNNPALGGLGPINNDRLRDRFINAGNLSFFSPLFFASVGLPTTFNQALTTFNDTDSAANLGLRYYQSDFFGQEEVRLRRNLSLSFGVRYEYNTPISEINDRFERNFSTIGSLDPGGLRGLVTGRTQIYDPDKNNIAPRIGVAWAPNIFGPQHSTVFRGGFGVFYDQILGSVASQSRNLFPAFLPLNFSSTGLVGIDFNSVDPTFGGPAMPISTTGLRLSFAGPGSPAPLGAPLSQLLLSRDTSNQPCIFISSQLTPACQRALGIPIIRPGTLNVINPDIDRLGGLNSLLSALNANFPRSFSFTLPRQRLEMPMAYHYSYTVEQQLSRDMFFSVSYVGTTARNLLRITTPNGGPNATPVIQRVDAAIDPRTGVAVTGPSGLSAPQLRGFVNLTTIGRTNRSIGTFNQIETRGRSHYDAFQFQLRGRYARRMQYQVGYTFSKSFDQVSDVFDTAGEFALPQDSQTLSGEFARSSFDVPHRLSYNLIWDVPGISKLQIASTGQFQSGQTYTINTIQDVNLDGNLTDRLNTTRGLVVTDDRSQPIQLASGVVPSDLLAPVGFSGSVRRNSFRAANFGIVNLAVVKRFNFFENQEFSMRMDVFNLTNRDNFGIPVRILEAPGFGKATDTVTPGRRIQFALKYSF